MKGFGAFSVALGLAGLAQAHMEMTYPAPFKSKYNPYSGYDIDYSMTSPLLADGSNFPCKGYQSLLGTSAGSPTATWQAGNEYNMTIVGGASHGGGSCQASLSFDKGSTWTVIMSYIGNCPISPSGSFDFTLPVDTPAGEALFAWSWFNKIGNREMYMNCAAITVTAGSGTPSTPISQRPAMFVANVGNGCATTEMVDLMFPNPGPDVDQTSTNTGPPVGNCASGSGSSSTTITTTTSKTTTASTKTSTTTSSTSSSTQATTTTSKTTSTSTTSWSNSTQTSTTKKTTSSTTKASTTTTKTTLSTTTRSSTAAATSTGTATGLITPGTPCTPEGYWNCLQDGKSFQRCASGTWSVAMAVAPGTKCTPGQSLDFVVGFARK